MEQTKAGSEFIDNLLHGMGPRTGVGGDGDVTHGAGDRDADNGVVRNADSPAEKPASRSAELESILARNIERLRQEGRSDEYIKSYTRGWRGKR